MSDSSPRLLGGRYEVGELIGRGGMAEVHVGHDTRLGRTVAIKVLRSDLARDSSFLARFRREAQAAAGLNHPAIVAVYDSGEQEVTESGGAVVHLPYIIMEHVDGRTLRDVLHAETVLDPDEAARVTAGVLAALEYSHDKGIVHRDIKPANVMVTKGGAVKVMDFGIARALADTAATMTQTQAVLGTARYLSPEQAQGEDVDARSDLYSAGCLLYELLTGRTPFVGDPVSLVYQHLREVPQPPSVHRPEVPPALDAVVLHALVKDRQGRYQRAADFRDDLQAARAGRMVSAAAQSTADDTLAAHGALGAAAAGASPTRAMAAARRDDGTGQDPDDTAEIPLGEEKRRRSGYVALGVLAVLAVLGLGWAVAQAFAPTDDDVPQVSVPHVVTMEQQEAEDVIAEANLEPVIELQEADQPEGQVIDQDPQAGIQVDEGSAVVLTVSSGPDAVTVPDVTNFAEDSARTQLENLGLQVAGESEVVHDPDFQEGRVARTDPEAGQEVPSDTTVTLFVASGQVEMPDLTGMSEIQASVALDNLRLQVGQVEHADSDQPENTVLEQSIEEGELVDYETSVDLTVARAPDETVTQTVTQTPTTSPEPTQTTTPDPTTPDPTTPDPTTTDTPEPTQTTPGPTSAPTASPTRSDPPVAGPLQRAGGRGPDGEGPPGQSRRPGSPPGQGNRP